MKTGRNEACACGSGKKTKHCCGKSDPALAKSNRIGLAIGAIVVVAAVAVIASMRDDSKRDPFSTFESAPSTSTAAASPAVAAPAATAISPTDVPEATPGPQPAGPAPAGKVWAAEHGHWHDKVEANPWVNVQMIPDGGQPSSKAPSAAAPASAPATVNIPKPDVPTPPGKVWSAEHGHWHDAATGVAPVKEVPPEVEAQLKPPGVPAAPAGMVWSEEHKHWHKAGAATATTTTTTAPTTTTNPQ
ncbi:MAG: SEC-C metal-binding domain-containing protein [Thermoanaerobaculia bacterium]